MFLSTSLAAFAIAMAVAAGELIANLVSLVSTFFFQTKANLDARCSVFNTERNHFTKYLLFWLPGYL